MAPITRKASKTQAAQSNKDQMVSEDMAPKTRKTSKTQVAQSNKKDQMRGGSTSRGRIQEEEESLYENIQEDSSGVHTDEEQSEEIQYEEVESDKAPYFTTRHRIDAFGNEIFSAGLARRPTNPYYVTRINLKRPNDLFVSMDVLRNRVFDLPESALLVDSNGRKWRTKLLKWKDGRTIYRGGWKYLCMNHKVQEDDSCIIEFVRRGNATDIHVNIVRADRSS